MAVMWWSPSSRIDLSSGSCVHNHHSKFSAWRTLGRSMLRSLLVTCAALLCLAAPASAATTLSDVTIPASDGVSLVGDVHLPPETKRRKPPVLEQHPSD